MTTLFHSIWMAALLLLSVALTGPSQAQTLAQNPELALVNNQFQYGTAHWQLDDPTGMNKMDTLRAETIPLPGQTTNQGVLRIVVSTGSPQKKLATTLRQNVGVSLAQNESVRLSFWAKIANAADPVMVTAGVEEAASHRKILWDDTIVFSSDWKHYEMVGKADRAFTAGSLRVLINMSSTIAFAYIADVRLEDPDHPAPVPPAPVTGTFYDPVPLIPRAQGDDWPKGWNFSGLTVVSERHEFSSVARLDVTTVPADPGEARFSASNPNPVNGGDVIAVRILASSPTNNKISLVFQKSTAPFDKFINQTVTLTPGGEEYRFVGVVSGHGHFEPGQTNFEIHAGSGTGTIKIGQIQVEDYGPCDRDAVGKRIGGETID